MATKTFNVSVVGYGLSAKIFHIPFILLTPQLKLHSIVQRSPKNGSSAPDDYPSSKHFRDFKTMLADPEVDIVVITTPPHNHFEFSKASLLAGKHVLTEKPFVPTAAEAEELASVAKEQRKILAVYQNRRWDLDFLIFKELVSQGTLGRILEINTHFDRYCPDPPTSWLGEMTVSSGGSSVYELGSHLIDQVYSLFGLPMSVRGRLLSQRRGEVDLERPDAVSAELFYSNGLLAHVRICDVSAEQTQPRFWIRGTKGSFHKLALDPQEDQLRAGMKPNEPGFGVENHTNMKLTLARNGKLEESEVPKIKPETYLKFYAMFAQAVETGKEEDIPVSATEGRDVLRIIEAIIESARMNKEVGLAPK